MFSLTIVHDSAEKRFDAMVVSAAKREEREFFIARAAQRFFDDAFNDFRSSFAIGAIDIACLTESTAPLAATGNFHT